MLDKETLYKIKDELAYQYGRKISRQPEDKRRACPRDVYNAGGWFGFQEGAEAMIDIILSRLEKEGGSG